MGCESTPSLIVSSLALLATIAAAIFAWWSYREATRANNIGRLNALLALRSHYLALMDHQGKLAKLLENSPSGSARAQDKYADLDEKLREVGGAIEKYHAGLVAPQPKSMSELNP